MFFDWKYGEKMSMYRKKTVKMKEKRNAFVSSRFHDIPVTSNTHNSKFEAKLTFADLCDLRRWQLNLILTIEQLNNIKH